MFEEKKYMKNSGVFLFGGCNFFINSPVEWLVVLNWLMHGIIWLTTKTNIPRFMQVHSHFTNFISLLYADIISFYLFEFRVILPAITVVVGEKKVSFSFFLLVNKYFG